MSKKKLLLALAVVYGIWFGLLFISYAPWLDLNYSIWTYFNYAKEFLRLILFGEFCIFSCTVPGFVGLVSIIGFILMFFIFSRNVSFKKTVLLGFLLLPVLHVLVWILSNNVAHYMYLRSLPIVK
ncbi:MAG: hypothetical protein AAB787_01330 [Patescibacteria group bacterium]